jgi:hypothetical protein
MDTGTPMTMFDDEDKGMWINGDKLVEVPYSEIKTGRSIAYWKGVLVGLTITTIAFAAATLILFDK